MANDTDVTGPKLKGRKKSIVLGIAVCLVMLLEGGGLYLAMKLFEPKSVDAARLGGMKESAKNGHYGDLAELIVADIKAPWVKTGRTFIFEVTVAIRVSKGVQQETQKALETNEALISDRLSRIIRSAEPNHLEEDGLETIRRQIKHELGVVLGDASIIGEVLIPRFIKFRADY